LKVLILHLELRDTGQRDTILSLHMLEIARKFVVEKIGGGARNTSERPEASEART